MKTKTGFAGSYTPNKCESVSHRHEIVWKISRDVIGIARAKTNLHLQTNLLNRRYHKIWPIGRQEASSRSNVYTFLFIFIPIVILNFYVRFANIFRLLRISME